MQISNNPANNEHLRKGIISSRRWASEHFLLDRVRIASFGTFRMSAASEGYACQTPCRGVVHFFK
jgi:hypothetical protein